MYKSKYREEMCMLHRKFWVPGKLCMLHSKFWVPGKLCMLHSKFWVPEKCVYYTQNSENRGYVIQKIVSTGESHSTQKFLSTELNVYVTQKIMNPGNKILKKHIIFVLGISSLLLSTIFNSGIWKSSDSVVFLFFSLLIIVCIILKN